MTLFPSKLLCVDIRLAGTSDYLQAKPTIYHFVNLSLRGVKTLSDSSVTIYILHGDTNTVTHNVERNPIAPAGTNTVFYTN